MSRANLRQIEFKKMQVIFEKNHNHF